MLIAWDGDTNQRLSRPIEVTIKFLSNLEISSFLVNFFSFCLLEKKLTEAEQGYVMFHEASYDAFFKKAQSQVWKTLHEVSKTQSFVAVARAQVVTEIERVSAYVTAFSLNV